MDDTNINETLSEDSPPPEDSWENLAKLSNITNPLFEKTLFLLGYDYSSNIFLIQGDYHSIIDPGNDYTAFLDLVHLGFNPPDIKKIVLTHSHHDHVMGTFELFRGYPGYKKDLQVEVIIHEAGPQEFKEMVKQFGCRLTEVKGGEILELSGLEFEVIHAPGHTLDGICLFHAPSRTLFTGDTVLPHAMAEMDQDRGGRMDHYLYALRTLLKKEIDHVLPGHGGVAINIGRKVVEETYEGLIKKVVGPDTPWMQGATTLAQQGLLSEGLFYVDKELSENPENPRAIEFKAFLLNDLGRNQEALEWFDKVLAQKSDHVHALLGKGSALLALGRHEESLKYFDHVLKIDPPMKEAQVYKGMALYLAGRYDEAMDLEAFRADFTDRFKEELAKKGKPEG